MRVLEYAKYDALGLKQLLDAGELSPKELLETALHATETLNPRLNVLSILSPELAAQSLASNTPHARFAGVPFLMKEGAGIAGLASRGGSRLIEGLTCEQDSELVRRLKRSGVITFGCTNVPEFGNATTTESVLFGPARNPWNLNHSVGGSSGGAASAVAAGIVPMAHGSDGAGSIRVPAHCCGVFGLMPSRGRTPCADYGGSFGIIRQHVITRTVRDCAAMLDELHGPQAGALFRVDRPTRPFLEEVDDTHRQLKIAVSTASPSGRSTHPDCIAAVENAARICGDLGHHVEYAAPEYHWETFVQAFADNWCFNFNFVRTLARQLGRQIGPDSLERSTLLTVERCRSLSSAQLYAAFSRLHAISLDVEMFFSNWDVFLSPVCLTPAPLLGVIDSNSEKLTSFAMWIDNFISNFAAFTPIFNVSGQPAVSVPLSQSADGLPIGVQCAARVGDEATLFQLAAQFEQACPWMNRKPLAVSQILTPAAV